jgi:hypothetical protein
MIIFSKQPSPKVTGNGRQTNTPYSPAQLAGLGLIQPGQFDRTGVDMLPHSKFILPTLITQQGKSTIYF